MSGSIPPFFAPGSVRLPEVRPESAVELALAELSCRGCARRAEAVLLGHPGVTRARVRDRRALVRFDAKRTSTRELCGALARAGYPSRPAAVLIGPRAATAAAAFAGTVTLALIAAWIPAARAVGLAAAALATIACAVAMVTIGPRAVALARRGLLDRDALWLAAAAASLALGARELGRGEIAVEAWCALGLCGGGVGALGCFVTAAGVAALAVATRFADDTLARRAVAEGAARWPIDDTWEDAATRGIVAAALGSASFAVVTQGCLRGAPLDRAAIEAAIATLVVASPAAVMVVMPAARTLALVRARALGALVKDAGALEALAAADVACFEKSGTVTAWLAAPLHEGAAETIRALGARGIPSALLSGDTPAETERAAAELGVTGAGGLGPVEKAAAIRDLRLHGLRVALVTDGHHDAAPAAQADVAVAIAPDRPPGAVPANIVVYEGGLGRLPALVDLARALRSVLRWSVAIGLVYNAALIPAAAMGFIPPLAAAGLSLIELVVGLAWSRRRLRARS